MKSLSAAAVSGPGPINFAGTPYLPNPPNGPLTKGPDGTLVTSQGADLPQSSLTPGAWLTQSVADISESGWAQSHRSVTTQEKNYIDQLYGIEGVDRSTVEYDHLIPLELGGGNDVTNIFPEPIAQAHVKDHFENWLAAEVKAGKINIVDAQKGIASDWNAYAIEVGAPANCHL